MSTTGTWREIPQDKQLEEGDLIRTHHCVQAPDVPFNDVLAELSIGLGTLTGQINNEMETDCLEVEAVDTSLERSSGVVVDGDECEFIYTVTHQVTHAPDDCEPELQTASVVSTAITLALSALIIGLAITFVLHQTEQLFTGESGGTANTLVLAGLVAAVGYAAGNIGGEDGLLEEPREGSHTEPDPSDGEGDRSA